MKKIICLLLAAVILAGCQASPAETTAPAQTTMAPAEAALPQETAFPTLPVPESVIGGTQGEGIPFANPGKARIAYTGPRSYVMYVTSVEDLPNEEALAGYDEAFFANHALLLLVETATSGSVQLEIGSISLDGNTAIVRLNRSMPGDVGTADMATWLLWAEVEKDLDYDWVLDNGSREPQNDRY